MIGLAVNQSDDWDVTSSDDGTPLMFENWEIELEYEPIKFVAPSFIRLFVIKRILDNWVATIDDHDNHSKNSKDDNNTSIKNLIDTEFTDSKMRESCYNILSRLMNGCNGLAVYMKNWYNEEQQAKIIEMIFNRIILKIFPKEYQRITSYVSDDHFYQCMVFNTNDLMYLIFEHLDFWNGELCNCTLVNTHWLYQIWNGNSLSRVDLTSLIKKTLKCSLNLNDNNYDNYNYNMCTRMWQRIINAKHIYFDWQHGEKVNSLLLNRLSMLHNIKKLHCEIEACHTDMLKILVHNCKDRIEYFNVHIFSNQSNFLSPSLNLINAIEIIIQDLYFYINWSIKCQILELKELKNIDHQWIKHVITNCNCKGVKSLTLDDIDFSRYFDLFMIDKLNKNEKRMFFNKFGEKFENLEKLEIIQSNNWNELTLLLVQSLKNIIEKNNVQVELKLFASQLSHIKLYQQLVADNKFPINRLSIAIDENFSQTIQLIGKTTQCLKYLEIRTDKFLLPAFKDVDFSVHFSSLEVIEIVNGNSTYFSRTITHINDFLQSNVINTWGINLFVKCQLFVHLDSINEKKYSQNERGTAEATQTAETGTCKDKETEKEKEEEKKFEAEFIQLCCILNCLLTKKSFPFDIRIYIWGIPASLLNKFSNDHFLIHLKIEDILKGYKSPKLNSKQKKYCQALPIPLISFSKDINRACVCVTNAELTRYQ